jgi:hypothetical protein
MEADHSNMINRSWWWRWRRSWYLWSLSVYLLDLRSRCLHHLWRARISCRRQCVECSALQRCDMPDRAFGIITRQLELMRTASGAVCQHLRNSSVECGLGAVPMSQGRILRQRGRMKVSAARNGMFRSSAYRLQV